MSWGDAGGFWTDREAYTRLYESEEVLTLDELPWARVKEPRIHHPVLR